MKKLSKVKLIILMSAFVLSSSVLASKPCGKDQERMLKQDSNSSIKSCVTYQQILKGKKENYLTMLDELSLADGSIVARVRHFVEVKGQYKILFNVDDSGESFQNINYKGKDSKVVVTDVNGDGIKDVIFRNYVGPTALIYIHSFNSSSEKIEMLGMLETGFGEAEFYPYLVSDIESVVKIEEDSILIDSKANGLKKYKWVNNAFISQND